MTGYQECVRAYVGEQYGECIRIALPLLESDVGLELLQLVLISLQHLGKTELAEVLGRDGLQLTQKKPWEHLLIKLALGQAFWPQVLFTAADPHQRCQAYYYTGARSLIVGQLELASQAFLACQSTQADCLEFELAQSGLHHLAPPGTQTPDNKFEVERIRVVHEGITGEAKVLRPTGSTPLFTSRPDATLGGWLSTSEPAAPGQQVNETPHGASVSLGTLMEDPVALLYKPPEPLRVFISSTFRDMFAEREVLVKRVFPELRSLCLSRGLEMIEVDLRWGIPEEKTKDVLPICFSEIENCQYFVALLGSRYGSLPDAQAIGPVSNYAWLKGYESRSITELEILCRLRDSLQAASHSFYYFRQPNLIPGQPDDTPARDDQQSALQERLKEHIRRSGCTVRENYLSPESVGQQILADLTEAIQRDYPLNRPNDPVLEDRFSHQALAAAHLRGYVPRQSFTDLIDQYLETTDRPVMVVGGAGSGKSALLSSWVHRHRNKATTDIIIEHYVGANARSANSLDILKRIIAEIKRHYPIDPEFAQYYAIPEGEMDPGTILSAFHNHLFLAMRLRNQRLILVLDGLDQLSAASDQNLWWLPEQFTDNIKVVLSARPGPSADCARDRSWLVVDLPAFTVDELSHAVMAYLQQYGKELGQNDLRCIVTAPQVRQPLFLRILLNEIRVFGSYENLSQCISDYLAAPDLTSIYARVFQRWQKDYNTPEFPGLVQDGLSLLAMSREGLAETEWIDLVGGKENPLPRAVWAPFYLALQPHLIQKGGSWEFTQQAMSEAVETILLTGEPQKRHYHAILAAYFTDALSTDRRFRQRPWHLQRGQDWDELKRCLSDLDLLEHFVLQGWVDELLAFWKCVGSISDMVRTYEGALESAIASGLKMDRLGVYCINLGDICVSGSQFSAAERFYRRALGIAEEILEPGHPSIAVIQTRLGRLLNRLGKPAEAEDILLEALHAKEKTLGPIHLSLAASLSALGDAYEALGQWQAAVRCCERAFEIYRFIDGELHANTATCALQLARIFLRDGQYERALEFSKRVVVTNEQLPGKEGPLSLQALEIQAEAYLMKRNYREAETLYQQVFNQRQERLGLDNPSSAMTLSRIGLVKALQGDKSTGSSLCRQALEICLRTVGPDHPFTVEARKVALLVDANP